MDVVAKALWFIEIEMGRELTLDRIASICEVSRFGLARSFAISTGWPVMRYVRARRLSRAARELAQGAPDILSVALDTGYGSHEAFTRAFHDLFGITPERVFPFVVEVDPAQLKDKLQFVPLRDLFTNMHRLRDAHLMIAGMRGVHAMGLWNEYSFTPQQNLTSGPVSAPKKKL